MTSTPPKIRLSVRLDLPNGDRFGPGMATLLDQIAQTGSIRSAASALGMSYPKALKLVDAMNAAFESALIDTRHGGQDRGGAALTETGETVLALYNRLCDQTVSDAANILSDLQELVKQEGA